MFVPGLTLRLLQGHIEQIFYIECIKEAGGKEEQGIIIGEESDIIQRVWKLAIDVDLYSGFNIFNVDLTFIMQRFIFYRAKPATLLDFTRYRSEPTSYVMWEWVTWDMRDAIVLDTPGGNTRS